MRRVTWLLLTSVLLALLVLAAAGEWLTRPKQHPAGAPPADTNLRAVRIPYGEGGPVAGWWAEGRPGAGAVLLLHGIGADRRQMLARARFLQAAGLAVLLIDLPAHGESVGERITFGWREASGVRAALGFLKAQLPDARIGVIGYSLGGASFLFANAVQPAPVDVVVLEAVYPTLREAVHNRLAMRVGPLAAQAVAPALLVQLPLRLDVHAGQLQPVEALKSLRAPVLVISGTEDRHTTADETRRLFGAARMPRELWLVDGAAHVDLHGFAPAAYESRVLGFLQQHLNARR